MRILSFIIAVVTVMAGPSLAGGRDSALPGIGTFAYGDTPVAAPASVLLVASR